jgi:hypothetical protein
LNLLIEVKDQMVDLDPIQVLHRNCTESNYHLPVFVAREFTKRAKKFGDDHGILLFDAHDIGKVLGKMPERFRDGPTGGMIVSIKPEYLEALLREKPPVVYVKGGPGGKFLKKGDTIAFYSKYPRGKIDALGTVLSVELGSPSQIWSSFGKKMAFSNDEFVRFSSLKRSILAISLSEVWRINPIEGSDLGAMVPKKDRGGSYIDIRTADRLKKKGHQKKTSRPTRGRSSRPGKG